MTTAALWSCSCLHYFDEWDIARQHSRLGHDVRSREYADLRTARARQELDTAQKEAAA